MTSICAHCGLPVGQFGERRELEGVERGFCCYGCCLAYQVSHGAGEEPEAVSMLLRLGVGGFLGMNIMLFSLLLYAQAFSIGDAVERTSVHWVLLGLGTALLAVLGGPFLQGAWQALCERRLTADTLVSVGAMAAYGYSAYGVVTGAAEVYFDTGAMVLMLFTLGRYLEAQGRVRAMRSLAPMLAGERADVVVIRADGEELQPVSVVRPGDTLRIRPGERIGVDGRVVSGFSECDESILTGQPEPRPKGPGDAVCAGSLNGHGQLLVCALVPGSETRWILLCRLVREALACKSPFGETLDRAAAWFVPAVLVLALATAGVWAALGSGVGQAMLTGLAVLVVACPCSLGLAASVATSLGIGQAAQRGILIRGGRVLEKLARIRCVAFDKTGTLTVGSPEVVSFQADGATASETLRRASRLALGSEHPLARAVVAHALQQGIAAPPAENVRAHPGAGVEGCIDGSDCAMGSAVFMGSRVGAAPAAALAEAAPAGATAVYVGWEGQVRGRLLLVDPLRARAREVVAALRARGLHTVLLSGDGAQAVAPLAASLGIVDWHAGLMPEAKVRHIAERLARRGLVAMVGDGLNDGPVLATAAVGVALGSGTDLAKESADVILPGGGLELLPWVLDLSQQVRRSVRANLFWAFGYNSIALTLAAGGLLQPAVAAALMAGSSVVVIARTLRASRRLAGGEREPAGALPQPGAADVLGVEA